ncbi:tetratricopeptide repeat protein [Mangrovimonas sp. DI 80]|uniref:tetratricopeptide repeat-containing sensor histidine kinase n=1 Tax=Mangrovimonas sp. DI 80 TaxID=1779330 RepID=UPI0009FAE65D|nr:tetratricopeptide repeat protein [Mangrovimonas sp. DI 80]
MSISFSSGFSRTLLLSKNCTLVLFGLLMLASIKTYSQSSGDFYDTATALMKTTPKNYEEINEAFKSFRRDSIKMKTLATMAEASNYLEAECYAYNSLGVIYRNISHYEIAIENHKKAYELSESANNIELQVICLNMLGVVYRRMDLVKPALDYHKKALDLANSQQPLTTELKHSIAVSQNSMGNIYLALNQYDMALKQFTKSLVIEKEQDNILGLAINYQNIGYANEAKGLLDEALIDYKTSLEYNNQINSDIGRVICNNSIAQIYIKQGKPQEAKEIIEDALKMALMEGDQLYIASSYINLGWAQNELGLHNEAENNLKTALDIGTKYGLKGSKVEANKHLSELYQKLGNYKAALEKYKDYIAEEETILNERNLQYVNDIIIQYESEIKNNQIRVLASENELVKSKLLRNQKIFWYSLIALILIAGGIITVNRHRQLKQEKQILTLEQDMLRSQMNPHFIFNSLNSIKLYIINNEKENAVYYLNKFSKLIRKILIASTEKEISLEDELDTMKLYMNIENIRFSNEIDFKVKIDDNINTANVKLPSLILQPFLENALWHGLSSKKEDKKIVLHASKTTDDYVTISIKDNGIGRIESEKINKNKLLKRKSVGIALTKARLSNFYKTYTSPYKIEVEDLYDTNHKPTGTKVIIHIPTRSNVLRTA